MLSCSRRAVSQLLHGVPEGWLRQNRPARYLHAAGVGECLNVMPQLGHGGLQITRGQRVQPFQRALRRIRGQPGLQEPDHLAVVAKVGRELLIGAGYDARQMIWLDDTYALKP